MPAGKRDKAAGVIRALTQRQGSSGPSLAPLPPTVLTLRNVGIRGGEPVAEASGGPTGLDAAAMRAVRLAAEIGGMRSGNVYVSFTTLLLALIYAEEDVSRRFRSALETASPGVVTRILSTPEMATRLPEAARQVAAMARFDWPTGRPLLSTSARNVLDEATASRRAGSRCTADRRAARQPRIPPRRSSRRSSG